MYDISFNDSIKKFDVIVSNITDANEKNNILFRRICKEVFQKSHTKLKSEKNLESGAKMLGAGIASLIQMYSKSYQTGSFEKSVQKLNPQDNVPTNSDMSVLNRILENGDFAFVVKLLKIQHVRGLNEAISMASQYH